MNRADRAVTTLRATSTRVANAVEDMVEGAMQWLARRVAAATAAAQSGQSMVEYAVIIALIAVVSMVAIQALGGGITAVFQNILVKIQGLGR